MSTKEIKKDDSILGFIIKKIKSYFSLLNLESIASILLVIALVVFCIRVYYVSTKTITVTPQVVQKIPLVNDSLKDSTQEYKEEVMGILKQKIDSSETEREKVSYMLQYAYKNFVNRVEVNGNSIRQEGLNTLAAVYEAVSSPTTKITNKEQMKEAAIFGYIFSLIENCFPPDTMTSLPEPIRAKYFSIFEFDPTSNSITSKASDNGSVLKMYMLQGFIQMLDDESMFSVLKMDASFNGYSVILKAFYLDSYSDKLTKEEIEKMVSSIKNDIYQFNNNDKIYFSNGGEPNHSRITIVAPMQIAFAEYVVGRFENNLVDDHSKLDAAYNQIQNVKGDNISKAVVSSFIKIYTLGIMNRGEYSKIDVDNAVNDLRMHIKNYPQIVGVIRGYLNFGLTSYGKWMLIKQDFFSLADKSESLKAFLKEIGINGY